MRKINTECMDCKYPANNFRLQRQLNIMMTKIAKLKYIVKDFNASYIKGQDEYKDGVYSAFNFVLHLLDCEDDKGETEE